MKRAKLAKLGRPVGDPLKEAETILGKAFPSKQVPALLSHFDHAVKKYQESEWENCLLKSGKFVEAILKCLVVHCGQNLPPSRQFSVNGAVNTLTSLPSGSCDDSIRLTIPKLCVFLYDITSNRGARHDPDKVDPNEMDATVAMPLLSWMLAELIRYSTGSSTDDAAFLVKRLTTRKYPYLENIEGRVYINKLGLKPKEIGILILNAIYPRRMSRKELDASIRRHGPSANSTAIALTRMKQLVDDQDGGWQLRGAGRREADLILESIR
jgi:hypothetical protein